jgi:thiamine phosphate synthase YjbQ (UPF0047 family)
MTIPTTHTIISRTDTGEFLCRFEFFSPEMPSWSHTDSESKARLNDPLNRRVGLKIANGKLVVGEWCSICIVRVA